MSVPSRSRWAIVSHVLPPQPSGQAMLLARLLDGMPAADYCLLATGEAGHAPAKEEGLPASCHRLPQASLIPEPGWPLLGTLASWGNALFDTLRLALRIRGVVRREQATLLVACSGALCDLPAAALASYFTGIPLVAYVMDDYVYQWSGRRRAVARFLERIVMARAACVLVLNEFARDVYRRRHGVEAAVLYNPAPLPAPEMLQGCAAPLARIVYTGALYHAQLDAVRRLLQVLERPEFAGLRLHVYTAQEPAALAQAGLCGTALVLHPHVAPEEVPAILLAADLLFLPLAFASPCPEVIRTSVPFKTGEYLAAGRPILVHAPADSFPVWYFSRHDCGCVVDSEDSEALAAALRGLSRDPDLRAGLAARARRRAEADFALETQRARFLQLLRAAETEG